MHLQNLNMRLRPPLSYRPNFLSLGRQYDMKPRPHKNEDPYFVCASSAVMPSVSRRLLKFFPVAGVSFAKRLNSAKAARQGPRASCNCTSFMGASSCEDPLVSLPRLL
jgi:hypothetical protein